MSKVANFSLQFFALALLVSGVVFGFRTSPLLRRYGGLTGPSWGEWWALQIRERLDDESESVLARLARLLILLVKYSVCAWGVLHFRVLSVDFWTLFWATLLVLLLLRKACQFHAPGKWEHVSMKLDAEHFWLIHLVLLGMAESQIVTPTPWGLISLIGCYVVVNGESGPSLLASFEDVIRVSLGVLAFWSLLPNTEAWPNGAASFFAVLSICMLVRGCVRAALGREWLKQRFWWIAQFCLMTSLIIKSMAVLDVFPFGRS